MRLLQTKFSKIIDVNRSIKKYEFSYYLYQKLTKFYKIFLVSIVYKYFL